MVTQADTVTNIRSVIDEQTSINTFWDDSEIRVWINDAVREIARTTETILEFRADLISIPNVARYALPADVIRLHRIEYVPAGSNQTYFIELRTYDELDQVWGIQQTIQSSYPSYAAIWGTPGRMTVQFYPVPAQGGVFNLYYYRMPGNLNTDGSDANQQLQIPFGWDDLVVYYAEFRARRKAKDQTWQDAYEIFKDELEHLVDVTRSAHDNGRFMQTSTSSGVPGWLTSFGDEW